MRLGSSIPILNAIHACHLLFEIRDWALASRHHALVELIDLYPTLCDLTGIPIPGHCQGNSFRKLLSDPEAGHRYEAYSSYPARKLIGHSIRIGNCRYTEWLDKSGNSQAKVLTDLKSDPGEETNVIDDPKYAKQLSRAVERLEIRVAQSQNEKASATVDLEK